MFLNPTAKNVILAGVRSVTVHDTATVALSDLSAQFYLSEQVRSFIVVFGWM